MLVAHRTVFKSRPVEMLNEFFGASGPELRRRYELSMCSIASS